MSLKNTLQKMTELYERKKSERMKSGEIYGIDCYAEVYKKARSRNEKRLLTAAMAGLHIDFSAWTRQESMAKFWLDPSAPPTERELRLSGGREAVLDIIRKGVLSGTCGVWSGDFWAGLKDSGLVRRKPGRSEWNWMMRFDKIPELAIDMEESKEVLFKLSRQKDSLGRRSVRSESSLQPAPDRPTAGWLAGLISGMVLVKRLGVWVLETRKISSRGLEWLKESGVYHCGAIGGGVWVSPFYMPLVIRHSPPMVGRRWEVIKGVRKEEILAGSWIALSTWEIVIGHGVRGHWPIAWGLPWAPSHATRTREGIDRDKAHMMGVSRGIGEPMPWLKELCKEWLESRVDKEELERLGWLDEKEA